MFLDSYFEEEELRNDLYKREEDILNNSENFIKWLQDKDMENKELTAKLLREYFKLHSEYEKMLKQVKKLTAISDKNQKRLFNKHKELKENNLKIRKVSNEHYENMIRDSLTGIFNRRFIEENLTKELNNCGSDCYCLLIDIDYFKRINDQFGHLVGDEVLISLSNIINNILEVNDLFGRYGGEEFICIIKKENMEAAYKFASYLREKVEEYKFIHEGEIITLTVSIGLTKLEESDQTSKDLIYRADLALYRAKDKGRNRIEVEKGKGAEGGLYNEFFKS